MSRKQLFIERREQGDYAVRKPNSGRASVVTQTQGEAIDWAQAHNLKKSHSAGPLVRRRFGALTGASRLEFGRGRTAERHGALWLTRRLFGYGLGDDKR